MAPIFFVEGDEFSVYMETKGEIAGTEITYTTVNIYSGVLTDDGIEDFTMGFIMTSKKNDTNRLMDVNEARVYVESDGLAASLDSNPGFNAGVVRQVIADGEEIKASIMSAAKR